MFFHRVDDVGPEDEAVHGVLALLQQRGEPAIAAVIPGHLRQGTVRAMRKLPDVAVFQHGFEHVNHARPGEWNDEFPASLGAGRIEEDLSRGRAMLEDRIGVSVKGYVPPWNRTSGLAHAAMGRLGFEVISGNRRYRPRTAVPRRDISVDVVTCCSPVQFRRIEDILGDIRAAQARGGPVGIMYHVQRTGGDGIRFVERLLREIDASGR